ncbi:hypothetical protein ACEQ8H_005355 [Pleosporales sp. CAS-2024a]
MLILKNGGTAVDAVEAAVKTLEDREITNAGYGSNLAMDGVVECDAAIVDHHGRSGAVGAVAQIKNPISLARLVHEHTTKSLTLRRVPPNLLVAQGATEFAAEMGMPILPHDALVSPAAKERWVRWRADLRAAERKGRKSGSHPSCWQVRGDIAIEDEIAQRKIRENHTATLLGVASLNRSSSPSLLEQEMYYTGEDVSSTPSDTHLITPEQSSDSWHDGDHIVATPDTSAHSPAPAVLRPHTLRDSSRNALINSTQMVPTLSQDEDHIELPGGCDGHLAQDTEMQEISDSHVRASPDQGLHAWADGSNGDSDSASSIATVQAIKPSQAGLVDIAPSPSKTSSESRTVGAPPPEQHEDHITDTVGAIAVDGWGNIACGASSGGIGMKYRGRVGPAALVGVGAAVIPTDPEDPEQACVATVASGTGEHMATTMAATVCAERLYQSVKKNRGGEYVEVSEDEALKAMIENEFMGHPSVKNSNSAGAIGILGLKRMSGGMLLYFGHNTDSFALASMSSDDPVPKCTMSRSNGNGQIAQGGRMLSLRRVKRTKTSQRYR